MTRSVFDTLVERCEIACAFSHTVTIGATPNPAFVVPLKKIPVQVVPPPFHEPCSVAAAWAMCFAAIVAQRVPTVNKKTLTRVKRNHLLFTRRARYGASREASASVASAFERSGGVAETALCGVRDRCAQRVKRCGRCRHNATVFSASAPSPRTAQFAAELPLLAGSVLDIVHTRPPRRKHAACGRCRLLL